MRARFPACQVWQPGQCVRLGEPGQTGVMNHQNLLPGPEPTHLPTDGPDATARALLAGGAEPRDAVPQAPAASLLWAGRLL